MFVPRGRQNCSRSLYGTLVALDEAGAVDVNACGFCLQIILELELKAFAGERAEDERLNGIALQAKGHG